VRQTRDPILSFKERLVASGLADEDELKVMEQEIRKSVDADMKLAKTDPEIETKELYYDVYENNLEGKLRGVVPWERHEHKKTQIAKNL
jgi:pyruvate dehydrogenase E1 component alpha subunit